MSRNLIETASTRLCTHFLTSFPVVVVVCLYAHTCMSSGFRVLENQDRELGIGDVGSLFVGRVFRLIAKFAALFIGGK